MISLDGCAMNFLKRTVGTALRSQRVRLRSIAIVLRRQVTSHVLVLGMLGIVQDSGSALGMARQRVIRTPRLEASYALKVENASFESILEKLGKTGLRLLVDGEPIVKQANVHSEGSLRNALDSFARAFGFDWKLSKSGHVLMTKNFQSVDDHPQVDIHEIKRVAADMVAGIRTASFDANVNWTDSLRQLWFSMTSDQEQILRSGQLLNARDLSSNQRTLLVQSVLGNTFSDALSAWLTFHEKVGSISSSSLQGRVTPVSRRGRTTNQRVFMLITRGANGREITTPFKLMLSQSEGER